MISMKIKSYTTLFSFICFCIAVGAQKNKTDSSNLKVLRAVIVNSYLSTKKQNLTDVVGTYLYTGKKTELISLSNIDADISMKSARQVFAKSPGIFVYDMDGGGNQVNIASRGLDPHRGWEFNIRKDGIITNSDMYGYPASHYSMPFESIERIEMVKGTGSLQYGAQYGGMLNYVSKKPDSSKSISLESIQTVGSYNMLSSYNALSGTRGNLSYYVYYYKKSRGGYRNGEQTSSIAHSAMIRYQLSTSIAIQAEWSRSSYLYKIPGQLNDEMFMKDPKQSTRNRNYFNPDIHLPSIQIEWKPSATTEIKLVSSAVLGTRNSVLFDKPVNIRDTINTLTADYNNRQVDIDRFNSYTTELRLLQQYRLGVYTGILVSGLQYMNNDLHRRQLGKGTTGNDFDLSLVDPIWGRDVHLKTNNIAFFAENKWQFSRKMEFTTGIRIESGKTNMDGKISYYPSHDIPVQLKHKFPLLGIGWLYKPNDKMQWYAGWSSSYRPMVFKDLIPTSIYEKVDPAIQDSKGYNAEMGFRGSNGLLKWDINWFMLKQNNRFGTLAKTDASGMLYTYRTNTGNSIASGTEVFIQYDWQILDTRFSLFTSTAFMNAKYVSGLIKNANNQNVNIKGNYIESAPKIISRNGATIKQKGLSFTFLYSYTSSTYADALNTETPNATGAVGKVPAYDLIDLSTTCRFTKELELRASINNLLNKQYFTKRPMFYPGPGIWPSDGRTFNLSIDIKL